MNIRIKKLDERATLPTYGTEFSAGADLYSLGGEAVTVEPHKTVLIKTGLAIEIPEGYCGLIFARSGLASKRGLAPANKVGVIDADYRGEVMVALHNHLDIEATVEGGERIAQLIVQPYINVKFNEVESIGTTARADGGFGSSGTK